jgi:hypothetical protein
VETSSRALILLPVMAALFLRRSAGTRSRNSCLRAGDARSYLLLALEERTMRYVAVITTLLMISGCSSGSSHSATLTLDNPTWDRVNVQAVVTRSSDCDDRQNGYVATDNFVMTKGHSHDVVAPNAETICWRHDRDPNNPVAGDWSGWSRATLFPGQTTETDL